SPNSPFSGGTQGSNSANSFAKVGLKPKNSASTFAMGDRVKHAQYGVGTIVTIDGAIASIAFSGLGIKKMNVEIAPIEKV
ncbi:hypothetical protein H7169_03660, partial [Candidatus Gracilibacteria bacterium]|nr:hypothetical protein [Candidatus Gracilibacteria bacterium]